jgi:hypothetical protein
MSYDVLDPAAARLWNYTPDWSNGFNVKRSYWTDVSLSRDNSEQRRALRSNPRFEISYRTRPSGDDFREAKHFLRAWQNKPTVIPDFSRHALLTDGSIASSTELEIDPLPVWAVAGQRAVLCGGSTSEEILIDSVAGVTITLTDPLANTWAEGSVLRPTFFGLMNGRIQQSRLTPGASDINVELEAYPGGSPPRDAGSAWATFNSREIFTQDPDFIGGMSVAGIWPVETIDKNRGWTAQFRPIDRHEQMVEAEFRGMTAALAFEVEQFFDRHKGRRTAFYLPSGEKDFDLAASAGSGTSQFLSTGLDIATDFGAIDYAAVETALAVYLTDGSRIYRRVTDIDSSGGNSRITVNAAWGVGLSTSNVARISWMPIARFASDEMTTSWKTPLAANARLAFQTVRR